MSDEEKLKELLKLKRYETPGEEYFRRFGQEFARRQQAAATGRHCSALSSVWQRVLDWSRDGVLSSQWLRLAIPAGALAALALCLSFWHGWESPLSHQQPPVVENRGQLLEVRLPSSDEVDSLSPASQKKNSPAQILPAGFSSGK